MTKVEINIAPSDWGNLVTKYSPKSKKLSNADFTDGTVNLDTDVTGSLTKRKGDVDYNGTLLAAAPKDQFEAIFSDGVRHLLVVQSGELKYSSGDTIFNTVVNGSGFSVGGNFEFATTQNRVYMGNGVNPNQVYDRTAVYGGAAPVTVPRLKPMGATAPSSAPTVAVVAGGAVPVGSHTYKITFEYYDTEESNGGPASALATTTAGNQTVNLTVIPIGGYGVTARKVYRDNNDGLWLHVGTVPNNTATTFSDTVAVGATSTEIPENNGTAPSTKYFTLWLDRLWLSGVPGDPYTLFYSEPQWPDIFGSENQILCNQEDPITGTVVYFDRIVVFNRKSFGQIIGSTPDTFRYASIPSSVGCVDNRTIQIRVIEGVPILIWLSDKGFYTYNGNAVNYISEVIEDLVNFNIQQALRQKNSVSHSSFSGTAEDGIDTTLLSSQVTTRGYANGTAFAGNNPRRNWDDTADWESAAPLNGAWTPNSNINTRTKDGDNSLRVPTKFATTSFANGTHAGTIGTSALTLPLNTAVFTGEVNVNAGFGVFVTFDKLSSRIIPTQTGRIIDAAVSSIFASFPSPPNTVRVYNDVAGQPGIDLGQANTVTLTAGTAYWIVDTYSLNTNTLRRATAELSGGNSMYKNGAGPWIDPGHPIKAQYTYCPSAVPSSGIWTSAVYDSLSAFVSTGLSITHTGTYTAAAQCSGTPTMTGQTTIEGSDVINFASGVISQSFSNVNGTLAVTLSGKRYWRIKMALTTSDNRATPSAGLPTLTFNTTATWESETIDTTLQSTVYNSLTTTATIPGGTSVTTTIATSASPTGPWTFVTFGSHIVRQYVRIRLVLTTDGTNTTTPSVSSVIFRWTLSAKYTSVVIDTAVTPPAGWDIFLADFQANGGTVAFEFASGPLITDPGTGGYPFTAIVPGDFPTNTPYQYAKWRVTLTSSDEDVPVVDSVTTQWFISTVSSIRPASIFVDGRYYVALAEVQETTNNVLLEFDLNGKWRRHSGLAIATFSFFFNRPYLGLSTAGQIRKFLEGFTDGATNITFDYRTKALDYSTTQYDNYAHRAKVVAEIVVEGSDTGASFLAFYSVDEGETFYPLYTNSGATAFTLGSLPIRLKPDWNAGNPNSGRTIMYRILNTDTNQVQIDRIKTSALVREQEPVITG